MSLLRRNLAGRADSEVDVTAFLSLMVILVPFLLITAVFSRMTILDLETGGRTRDLSPVEDPLRLQVLIREQFIEVRYQGLAKPIRFDRNADGEAHAKLGELAWELKQKFPQSSAVTLLLEPQVPYDELVQVMDAVRVRPQRNGEQAGPIELFSRIALGETAAVEGAAK